MNRIVIFLHYNNKNNLLPDYVVYWLTHLNGLYKKIIFVSNSSLTKDNQDLIEGLCNKVILRENEGFDFGGWKDAILAEGWEELSKYDSLTILNDSCFGPLFDFQSYFLEMEKCQTDFWGNTNHRGIYSEDLGCYIPEHIQSYFIVFNKQVIQSIVFQQFWEKVRNEIDVLDVIRNYEIQLTQQLVGAGFEYKVWIDTTTEEYEHYHPNLAHVYPYVMMAKKSPFIKVKNLMEFNIVLNEKAVNIEEIASYTKYPSKHMVPYLNQQGLNKMYIRAILTALYRKFPGIVKKKQIIKRIKNKVAGYLN